MKTQSKADLRNELQKYRKQQEIVMRVLGFDNPYPLEDVLIMLKEATEYLLHVKNYDGHNYEELGQCVRRANEIITELHTKEAHLL